MVGLNALRRLLPKGWKRQYHHLIAVLADVRYGRPSRKLVVVGVTGTDGKTTTASLIADVLAADGSRVGLSSSAMFQVGERRWLNESHLTMPAGFALQRLLRNMVDAGCTRAVIEVSSEGLAEYRHARIDFDIAVITNISSEHLEAHGSFESYRQAKGRLFGAIIRGGDKHFQGVTIPKATVVNLDDPQHKYFLQFWAEQHFGTALQPHAPTHASGNEKMTVLLPSQRETNAQGSSFVLDGQQYRLPLPGEFNIRNALQAIAVGRALGLPAATIAEGLERAHTIPGRWETFSSPWGWKVIVDYALTPQALEALYTAIEHQGAQRMIAVFGAAGGGRDTWKRPELGRIASAHCAHIILTTDDPYDESPTKIANAILAGVPTADQSRVETVIDRREAIRRAMSLAQSGDVIVITGMGSETSMVVEGRQVPWSDAQVVQEELSHG